MSTRREMLPSIAIAAAMAIVTLPAAASAAPTAAAKPAQAAAASPSTAPSTPPAGQKPPAAAKAAPNAATPERNLALRGGEEITAFGNLTIEGEDQIHFEFDRPVLELALDATAAPGLDMGNPADVLKRTGANRTTPFLAMTSRERSPYVARPWLHGFASGAVAVFKPAVTDVDRWTLSIVDSRGEVVAQFQDHGQPRAIVWDGKLSGGRYAAPGRTYSTVFLAYDRAGNKRSMVGEGFQVGPFRYDLASGPVFLFPASALSSGDPANPASRATPPLLLEAASWINQAGRSNQPLRVIGIARTREGASALA
ncbi:MAG TPA: hypothetical protein VNM87_11020, partial [Candidatus Udaeobacter sp.]|nr:hypothetical protein [Candidatus Udaeobacter sp.]